MPDPCKTITISNCPREQDCNSCTELYDAKCIIYNGEEFPTVGILKGKTLEEIIEVIGLYLTD